MQLPDTIPAGFKFLLTSSAGLHWFSRRNADGTTDFACYADVAPILDNNVAMQNHNDGWSVNGKSKSDKLLRRAASVPWALIHKWKNEEGIDYFSQDPDMQKKVKAKLNDREFFKLRTAEFRL